MIAKSALSRCWQWQIGRCVVVGMLSISTSTSALAQIAPDPTLGAERSVVTPNVNIRGIGSDRIDGGATRGANLFHSFSDFNVRQGRGVYFANPAGIENILTRVTGNNSSNILGRLGVLGGANLFLLNPNGIVFGPNASLDIQGSLLATTAERIQLGDTGYFSASQPQTSSLLSVSPGVLFFNAVANQPTSVINQGNLSTGKHLTLAAGNLDLQGQLLAGGDLTLQAQDTVKVLDSATTPFIASAKGNLLVQGNQRVDIFALNHPESGLFSGGDMVLRSSNTVGGDAHYQSEGSFRIEQLDGRLGNLLSLRDPILRVRGDVFLQAYQGASLHILAGGKVEIPGYVWIQGADPENGLVETVNLADGTAVSIDGKSEPTLDIRAGINPSVIGGSILTLTGTGTFTQPSYGTSIASSADIKIGTVLFADAASRPLAGRLLLTNQYQPNSSLSGNIQVTDTLPGWGAVFMKGGAANPSVAINSRGSITLKGSVNTSSSGNGGAIALSAQNNIKTDNLDSYANGAGTGGAIRLTTTSGNITTGNLNASSESDSGNAGAAGVIHLQAIGSTTGAVNGDISTGTIDSSSSSRQGNSGDGGDVTLNTTNGNISNGFLTTTSTSSLSSGRGGNITVSTANGSISGDLVYSFSSSRGNADAGGNITLNAANGNIALGRPYSYSSSNSGTAGNGGRITASTTNGDIKIDRIWSSSSGNTATNGGEVTLSVKNGGISLNSVSSGARTSTLSTGSSAFGKGGAITLNAINGNISTGRLESNVSAVSDAGNGGAITLAAQNGDITLKEWLYSGSFSTLQRGGRGGDITLTSDRTIQPDSLGIGNIGTINSTGALGSGNITINAQSPLALPNFLISSDTFGSGRGGDIQITAPSILLTDGSQISASTHSSGQGGNITLRADSVQMRGATTTNPFGTNFRSGFAELPPGTYVGGYIPTGANLSGTRAIDKLQPGTVFPSGAFTQTTVGATGSAGNIKIETGQLTIKDGAAIATTTFGKNSNAGNISVQARDSISVANGSILSGVAGGAIGDSGEIGLSTRSFSITEGGTVQTQTLGQGKAGNIQVNATDTIISGFNSTFTPSGLRSGSGGSNTQLGTASSNIGQSGDINVTSANLSLTNRGVLDAQTLTNSRGGNITVNATQSLDVNQASLIAQSSGAAPAGNITIKTQKLTARDGKIATSSEESSGGRINIAASSIRLFGNSDITSRVNEDVGGGGNIYLKADSILAFNDSDILAFSRDGSGGNITLDTRAFFGQNYRPASRRTDPRTLDGNTQVDVNATGTVASGTIALPDTTFIQNSLTELPTNQIDTSALLATSCIVRRNQPTQGSFTITGTGGLPQRPGDAQIESYSTVDIGTLPGRTRSTSNPNRAWQKGDPIVEPQGVYRLPNGKLVLSRACDRNQ